MLQSRPCCGALLARGHYRAETDGYRILPGSVLTTSRLGATRSRSRIQERRNTTPLRPPRGWLTSWNKVPSTRTSPISKQSRIKKRFISLMSCTRSGSPCSATRCWCNPLPGNNSGSSSVCTCRLGADDGVSDLVAFHHRPTPRVGAGISTVPGLSSSHPLNRPDPSV
jgi:hypothetical protein